MHDVVLIGAGPAAVGALLGLDPALTIAVVTGEVPGSRRLTRKMHAKIHAVSRLRNEAPGLHPGALTETRLGTFDTAIEGGLANYWGQQFVAYGSNDAWPHSVFSNFADYDRACRSVEAHFRIERSKAAGPGLSLPDFATSGPRLLVGTASQPDAGLLAMRTLLAELLQRRNADRIVARAVALERRGTAWTVRCSDGRTVEGRRILLAAGVIGTATLLLASVPAVSCIRLLDHAPWMVYTIGLLGKSSVRPGTDHFNALSITKSADRRCTLFASAYDLRLTEINLLLATATGLSSSLLSRSYAPRLMPRINPVQVWTTATKTSVDVWRDGRVVDRPPAPASTDSDFVELVDALRAQGVRVFGVSGTKPLRGFHYHSLQASRDGARFAALPDFLSEWSAGGVTAIDSSILPSIGCEPPTETAMASAFHLSANLAS